MKIELKKFTANERLSEETLAYAADVYVDGKKVGTAGNHGTGGPDEVRIPGDMGLKVQQYILGLPPVPSGHGGEPLKMTEDLFFGLLAEAEQKKRREARTKQRWAKFAASAKVRGFLAFVARYGEPHHYNEVLFEARKPEEAKVKADQMAAKKKMQVFLLEEVRP